MVGRSRDCFAARSTASYFSTSMGPGIHRKEMEIEEEFREFIRTWMRCTIELDD